VSFDLGIWDAERPPTMTEAQRRYDQLCRGQEPGGPASGRVAAFVEECGRKWPTGRGDVPFTTKRTPTGLLVRIEPESATSVYGEWSALADRHGLVLYDPQSGIVSIPARLSFDAEPPVETGHRSNASMLRDMRARRAKRRRS
jgi:hypothetical protein